MRTTLAQLGLVVLLVGLVAALVPVNRDLATRANLAEEFLPLWVAARTVVIEGQSAYDAQAIVEAYEAAFGTPVGSVVTEESLRYTRPLPGLLPVAPLALLPYPPARAIWLTLVELLQPILFLLALEVSGLRKRAPTIVAILLLAVLWRYGLEAMISGHIVTVEAALASVALLMFVRDRARFAGPVIAVGVLVGGLTAPLGLLLLLSEIRLRRWLYAVTAVGTTLGLALGAGSLFGGWTIAWLASLVEAVRSRGIMTPVTELGAPWLWAPLTIALIVYVLWQWIRLLGPDRPPDELRAWVGCLTLTVSFAVLGPLHPGGALMLAPALLLVARSLGERWGSSGVTLAAGAGLLLLVGPWLPLFVDLPLDPTGAWLYWLPLAVALLGLSWIRWWVVRGSQLLHPYNPHSS